MKGIWAVVYGNYFPYEVDSIWMTKEAAEQRVEEILEKERKQKFFGSLWEVVWIPFGEFGEEEELK